MIAAWQGTLLILLKMAKLSGDFWFVTSNPHGCRT